MTLWRLLGYLKQLRCCCAIIHISSSHVTLFLGLLENWPLATIAHYNGVFEHGLRTYYLYFFIQSMDAQWQNVPQILASAACCWFQPKTFGFCWVKPTLQMFCLLNSQTNVCEPNPKTTSSDFNRLESVTKIFCFHAMSKDIWLLF